MQAIQDFRQRTKYGIACKQAPTKKTMSDEIRTLAVGWLVASSAWAFLLFGFDKWRAGRYVTIKSGAFVASDQEAEGASPSLISTVDLGLEINWPSAARPLQPRDVSR